MGNERYVSDKGIEDEAAARRRIRAYLNSGFNPEIIREAGRKTAADISALVSPGPEASVLLGVYRSHFTKRTLGENIEEYSTQSHWKLLTDGRLVAEDTSNEEVLSSKGRLLWRDSTTSTRDLSENELLSADFDIYDASDAWKVTAPLESLDEPTARRLRATYKGQFLLETLAQLSADAPRHAQEIVEARARQKEAQEEGERAASTAAQRALDVQRSAHSSKWKRRMIGILAGALLLGVCFFVIRLVQQADMQSNTTTSLGTVSPQEPVPAQDDVVETVEPSRTPAVSLAQLKKAARLDPGRPDGAITAGAATSVRLFEASLVNLGFLDSKYLDGSYGTKTLQAMRAFQKSVGHHDLDGVPGPIELRMLAEASGLFIPSK